MKKNIKNENKTLLDLLKKYGFTKTIPGNRQKEIINTQHKNAKRLLKKLGKYNLFLSIILFIHQILNKVGIKISISAAKIIISTILIAGFSAGSYYSVKYLIIPLFGINQTAENINKEIKTLNNELNSIDQNNTREAVIKPVIEIGLFEFNDFDKKTGKILIKSIKNNLNKIQNKYIIIYHVSNVNKSKFFISGKYNNKTLRIYLYETKNGEIKFIYKTQIDGRINIENISNNFCNKLLSRLRKL